MCLLLPLLPADLIVDGFQAIRAEGSNVSDTTKKAKLDAFFDYIQKTWMEGTKQNKKKLKCSHDVKALIFVFKFCYFRTFQVLGLNWCQSVGVTSEPATPNLSTIKNSLHIQVLLNGKVSLHIGT